MFTLNGAAPGLQNSAAALEIVKTLHTVFAGLNEPTTWGVMLAGFGLLGLALRDRRRLALGEI